MDSSKSDVWDSNAEMEEGQAEPKQSRLISKGLAPAVGLWLRSQVEHIENLDVKIEAGDRQILSGCIPKIALSACKAVYQGLHLSQIQMTGQNIRVNLGQVLRGKSLQLLEPIRVEGQVLLQQADLNASLTAPLLANGVTEFLLALLRSTNLNDLPSNDPQLNLQNLEIILGADQITLSASLISVSGSMSEVAIRTGFDLASPHELRLVKPHWLPHAKAKRGLPLKDLDGYIFNLGKDTQIQQLTLELGQITCQAKLLVSP
jgi:LmeA-like phospholipid-binding